MNPKTSILSTSLEQSGIWNLALSPKSLTLNPIHITCTVRKMEPCRSCTIRLKAVRNRIIRVSILSRKIQQTNHSCPADCVEGGVSGTGFISHFVRMSSKGRTCLCTCPSPRLADWMSPLSPVLCLARANTVRSTRESHQHT